MRTIGKDGRTLCVAFGLLAAGLVTGCTKDPRELPKDMPPVNPGPFEAYGQKLDAAADPKTVATVWVRAMTDYIDANQAKDAVKRKAALAVLTNIAAADTLMEIVRTELTDIEPPVVVYKSIRIWAYVSGHYIHGVELDKIRAVNVKSMQGGPDRVKVSIPATGNDGRKATLVLDLRKERDCWRVMQVLPESAAGPTETVTITVPATRPQRPVTQSRPTSR